MKPLLALALIFLASFPVRADNPPAPALAAAQAPAPELVAFERELTEKLQAKAKGELTPEQYVEFAKGFRAKLDLPRERAS